MDPKERHDDIEAYLQRKMTPEVEAAFEQEMAQNSDLEKEVRLMAWTNMAVDLAIEDDIQKMVEEIREEQSLVTDKAEPEIHEPVIIPFWQQAWFRWAAAAMLIGVIIIGALPYINPTGPPPDEPDITQPAAFNLIDLPTRSGVLGGENSEDALEKGRIAFFDDEDYAAAEAQLETIPEDDTLYAAEARYLLGYTYFMQEKFQDAIDVFDSFITQPESLLALPDKYQNLEKLRWDRILALYGMNEDQPGKVRPTVEEFIQTAQDRYYRNKATQLLEKLTTE